MPKKEKTTAVLMRSPVSDAVTEIYSDKKSGPEVEQKWEDLTDLYNTIAQSIVEVSVQYNNLIPMLLEKGYSQNEELIAATNSFTRDIEYIANHLAMIYSKHKGRVGLITTPDDYAENISLFNDYVTLHERFRAVIFPSLLTMTEFSLRLMADEKGVNITDDGVVEGEIIEEKPSVIN